jgi:hypothetical protein
MTKSPKTYYVYLRKNSIDPSSFALISSNCHKAPSKINEDEFDFFLKCSKIDCSSPVYLQITAVFSGDVTYDMLIPHSIVLFTVDMSNKENSEQAFGFVPDQTEGQLQ